MSFSDANHRRTDILSSVLKRLGWTRKKRGANATWVAPGGEAMTTRKIRNIDSIIIFGDERIFVLDTDDTQEIVRQIQHMTGQLREYAEECAREHTRHGRPVYWTAGKNCGCVRVEDWHDVDDAVIEDAKAHLVGRREVEYEGKKIVVDGEAMQRIQCGTMLAGEIDSIIDSLRAAGDDEGAKMLAACDFPGFIRRAVDATVRASI